ncbi:SMP-30/gluconolactonase/LRE family protein [Blastococcus sp. PRF04-17]|uniref:SMP-30/gluconolactonase/LRE family protein n=1 Tax=Blastococcus sp. PRF04-17 TaxID=2933797 RepID=UPI001FF16980|nr:SMP-30/gluconolactonase/LRE family protein [Blastococcus sp. PRF04-17]UOY01750.1 SMP-30/gluconolactonase/LRE family protein [Blastococcus sp. PRF04-17]
MQRRGTAEVRVAVAARDTLGEGPSWHPGRRELVRVDIRAEQVIRWSADTGQETRTAVGGPVSLAVPDRDGGLVVAGGSTVTRWRADGSRAELCRIDPDTESTTLNDGKCDDRGRLWIGTYDRDGGSLATLHVVDVDGSVRVAETGLSASNGLAWDAESTVLYLVDTPRRVIWRYDYRLDGGELGDREVFARIGEDAGLPDGLATDTAGGVWVALFGGGAVHRYDAGGALTHVVPVPVTYPTSVAFGGDDLRTVFVTTSRTRLTPEQDAAEPLGGSVLAFDVDAPGVPVASYGSPG